MIHLHWHKKRLTILGPKIEGLPDDYHSKLECLFQLSRLFDSVRNHVEQKRLLSHALDLWKEEGSDRQVARILMQLSDVNRVIGLHTEGTHQAKEALGVYERLGDTVDQAQCLIYLAWSLRSENQLDAAEEAASRAIDLLPDRPTIPDQRISPCRRQYTSIQGRYREGDSPSRGSPRNCIPFRLARYPILDPLRTCGAVSRRR